jgi:hypothetical protein
MDYKPQTKDSITPKDKAIFTGIIIILIVVIAIIINLRYYNSIRDSFMSADFLVASAISGVAMIKPYIDCIQLEK